MPVVWAIVLHYQGEQLTRDCLASLAALDYPQLHVLLVDNGSLDKAGDAIARDFAQFDYLPTHDNLGFAGGCNAGAQYAIQRGARWVWFVNNDSRVQPNTLSLLIAAAQAHPTAAAVGALVCTPHEGDYVSSGLGEIDFVRAKTLMRKQPDEPSKAQTCEWLSGANLLVRCDVFQSLHGFDEDYFLYFEDTDLCFRLREAGWHCLLVPGARIFHEGGASTEGSKTIWRTYYYTRNRLLFFLSHFRGPRVIAPLLAMLAHQLRHCLVLPFRGETGKRRLKAELLGWRDYLQKRLGKADCLDW
jgi:GT2 family glycosyltransferase